MSRVGVRELTRSRREFGIRRGGPGEAVHGGVGSRHGLDPATREMARVEEEVSDHVQWSICSVKRPWRSRSRRRRGDNNGFDPEARDGHDCGKEPAAMYTSRFVQSWWPWRSRPRHRRESPGPNESDREASVVEETEGREGRNSQRLGSKLLSPVGPGRNQQDTQRNAKSRRERRDSGVVPEETTRSGEGQAS